MWRVIQILFCGLRLICPACRHGRMYRSLTKMNVRCPVCGMIFERDTGELTGAIWINATLTCTIAVVPALYFAFFTSVPLLPLFVVIACVTSVVGTLTYRPVRGVWISILYLTGSIHEH